MALAEHARLMAALQRPGALPGGMGPAGPVTLVETHLSSLLLAGDRVYKLKKPRRLAFVDFSTLALREVACREELRLNRRTAPAIYLAVLPVVQGADGPRIEATDTAEAAASAEAAEAARPDAAAEEPTPAAPPVIDWALQMARFDEQQAFDHLATRGALSAAQVEALALAVVQFQATLQPLPAGLGAPAATLDTAERNAAELYALCRHDPALAARTDALARWSAARGRALAPLMAERHAAGRVREGHGDLHLGNLVWHDGAPLLFDAIEFSPTLRQLDTVGDWAFTFMDLLARVGPDLAWRFASTLVEAADDHGALPLLPWWAVYRALVRAKVALLGPPGPAADASLSRYLGVAEALAALQPLGGARPAPWLVLMLGLSGSGKSAVAQGLVGPLGAVRLRSDVERKRLFGLGPRDRAPAALGLYSREATRRTYDRLLALAGQALSGGIGVVVDAANLRRAERAAFVDLARRLGARPVVLACRAPEPVLRERIRRRAAAGTDASDASEDVLALQQRVAEWPLADEPAPVWWLDTDAPPDEVLRRALALPWGSESPG